jgi:hypothetical protein
MSKLVPRATFAALLTTAVAHADPPEPKDPDHALMLSLGGTAASAALLVVGATSDRPELATVGAVSSLFTPSLGEWYAGKRLTAGMAIRVASLGVGLVGFFDAYHCSWGDANCTNSVSAGDKVLLVGGLVGYAAGTIYDIVDAPSSARDYNRAHTPAVMPTVMRTPSGDIHMGIGISGSL